jgi:hypothetical protein
MKIDFAVACDYAIVDQYGKLSVLGVFQHIWVAKFPAVHPRLHLVLRLKGSRTEVGNHPVSIRLRDEDGNDVLSGRGTVVFAEPPAGVLEVEAGAVLVFDVPFEKPGRYCFEITVDEDVRADVPITVAPRPSSRAPEGVESP